jgi:uncharacterized protein YjbJ (UPF0337 family)
MASRSPGCQAGFLAAHCGVRKLFNRSGQGSRKGSRGSAGGVWKPGGVKHRAGKQERQEGGSNMERDTAKGKLKKAAGDLTGDKDLHREGRVDEAAGKAKQVVDRAADKAKDAIRR